MKSEAIRPLVASGMVIGIGMGGFIDGIVFHQILQSHNMLSAKYPPTSVVNLEVNMFWDGMFHLMTWTVTSIGIAMLWRTMQRPDAVQTTRGLVGAMLSGWGLFNLVEGIINHHILHLHHVREVEDHLIWDIAFLASGVILLTFGFIMVRSAANSYGRAASAPGSRTHS
jgi:uncharacterized membrane protein